MPNFRKVVVEGDRKYHSAKTMQIGAVIEGIYVGRQWGEQYRNWTYQFFTVEGRDEYIGGTKKIDALLETAGIDLDPSETGNFSYLRLEKTADVIMQNGNTFTDFELDICDEWDGPMSALLARARESDNFPNRSEDAEASQYPV